ASTTFRRSPTGPAGCSLAAASRCTARGARPSAATTSPSARASTRWRPCAYAAWQSNSARAPVQSLGLAPAGRYGESAAAAAPRLRAGQRAPEELGLGIGGELMSRNRSRRASSLAVALLLVLAFACAPPPPTSKTQEAPAAPPAAAGNAALP